MNPVLRPLTTADLDFADSLRSIAGWNQTRADWRLQIEANPSGCFLAEWDGAPVGTATTFMHGPNLAWIGMVLVHPASRGRGVGTALMRQCLDHLDRRAVPTVQLDATPLGQPIYERLGFRPTHTLLRFHGSIARSGEPAAGPHPIRAADAGDLPAMQALLDSAFGNPRTAVLRHLLDHGISTLLAMDTSKRPSALACLRPGANADYLGPVVASSASAGCQLIRALLPRAHASRVYWDVPEPNSAAIRQAQELGFTIERSLVRMTRGPEIPGRLTEQFAIAGPELG